MLELDGHVRGDAPRLPLLRLGALDQTYDFRRNATMKCDVFFKQRHDAIRECASFCFIQRRISPLDRSRPRA